MSVPIPGLLTVSEQNMREHWRESHARHSHQKTIVALVLRGTIASMMLPFAPLVVTMTRVAPSDGLDTDNMVGSMKYIRDAIAHVIGIDDKDPRVVWRVEQRKGPWAVEIRIEVSDER